MRGQLYPLRLAAGERGRRLPQPQIAETNFVQHAQFVRDFGGIGEMVHPLTDRHLQNFVNIFTAIANFQDLGFEALALALLAHQFDIRQELHFHHNRAVTLASLAASTGDVEGKMSCRKAALVGFRSCSKQLAHTVKSFYISDGIGARRAPNRRLIHQYHFINEFVAGDLIQRLSGVTNAALVLRDQGIFCQLGRIQSSVQHVVQQTGLARTRNSRDRDQHS